MEVVFHGSPRSSVGLEWEVALVDADTLELVPKAGPILEALHCTESTPVRKEYLQCMIEMVSDPHARVRDAVADLARHMGEVRAVAEPLGVKLMGAGCHPFSIAENQEPFSTPRYDVVRDANQWWGRQMAIFGMHIHVGVANREHALPVTNGLARFYPFFLALSASSPLWQGEDTGYWSQRTMLFQQMPTNGLPFHMTTWEEFEHYAEELAECGMVRVPGEIRWDVRPSPRFGTVENRTPDSVPTLAELGAIGALTQCLAEYFVRDLEGPQEMEVLPSWFIRENKWRAARYGLDAEVITPDRTGRLRPLRSYLAEWLDRLAPIADDLECAEELQMVHQLLERGTTAERQRRVVAARGVLAAARLLVAETGATTPFPAEVPQVRISTDVEESS